MLFFTHFYLEHGERLAGVQRVHRVFAHVFALYTLGVLGYIHYCVQILVGDHKLGHGAGEVKPGDGYAPNAKLVYGVGIVHVAVVPL